MQALILSLIIVVCTFNISPVCYAQEMSPSSNGDLREIDPQLIDQLLQEVNCSFFYCHSMHLDLLKNYPQAIPKLAHRLYEEWHSYDASLTEEKLVHSFSERLNNDRLPITFVVLKEGEPIGCVSLKKQSDPEFSDFPSNSIWGGSLHVIPEERNKEIGKQLGRFSAALAKSLGYKSLYFYTSNPKNVEGYIQEGAIIIETRLFRNHLITIMQLPL